MHYNNGAFVATMTLSQGLRQRVRRWLRIADPPRLGVVQDFLLELVEKETAEGCFAFD